MRWGYGWRWPRSQPLLDDRSAVSLDSQLAEYKRRLQEAIEHDRR